MKTVYTFLIFLITFSITPTILAQDIQWYWSTEISPFSRSGNQTVLNPNNGVFNLEWRNRLGMEVGDGFYMGLQGNLRDYKVSESYNHTFSFPESANSDHTYDLSNTLWGVGPFLTKLVPLNKKITLQATLMGLIEQGRGDYVVTSENFDCPVCMPNFINPEFWPKEIENLSFRERNFYAAFEIGATYKLSPKISGMLQANLFQYENLRRTATGNADPVEMVTALIRPAMGRNSGFNSFVDRPMIYLGVIIKLK